MGDRFPAHFAQVYVDSALYPKGNTFELGVYNGAIIYADRGLFNSVGNPNQTIVERFIDKYFDSEILILEANSVVDYRAYALYQQGKEIRAYAGDVDHGVMIDRGEPLPEEQPFYNKSFMRDGQRVFTDELNGVPDETEQIAFAETLMFHIASRFFGCPLDQYNGDLYLERFYKIPWWKFWKK